MNSAAQQASLRGKLKLNEPLARFTSWRVGGPAEKLYQPADRADLGQFITSLPDNEPVFFMGMGSNILIRDGGIKGTVINLRGTLNALDLVEENECSALIYTEVGTTLSQLARFAVKHDLVGSEFLAGIPGSVGGALTMNAGCYGSETWEFVEKLDVINRQGQILTRLPKEYVVSYRSVQCPFEECFLAAWFRFETSRTPADRERIRELLNQRSYSQPIGSYSCGSVFRNPPDNYAAKLIESCGLKGYRVGGAHVSEKHANFILNDEKASAADIEQLINFVQTSVEAKTGIALQREVKIVGDPS